MGKIAYVSPVEKTVHSFSSSSLANTLDPSDNLYLVFLGGERRIVQIDITEETGMFWPKRFQKNPPAPERPVRFPRKSQGMF